MLLSKTVLFLAILPFSIASTCSEANALEWSSSGGGSSSGSSRCPSCGNDVACVKKCLALIAQGECNAVGCDNNGDGDTDDDGDVDGLIKKVKARASFTCTGTEQCYKYPDGSLLCVDRSTGEYTDADGGHGNGYTGVYTAPNGEVQTAAGGSGATETETEAPAATGTSGSAATSGKSSAASSTGAGTVKSASAGSSAASSTSAPSTTPTSGAERLRSGAAVGVLGFIAGLVL